MVGDEIEWEKAQGDPTYAYRKGREDFKRETILSMKEVRELCERMGFDTGALIEASAAIIALT